jgi:hypothetical protein
MKSKPAIRSALWLEIQRQFPVKLVLIAIWGISLAITIIYNPGRGMYTLGAFGVVLSMPALLIWSIVIGFKALRTMRGPKRFFYICIWVAIALIILIIIPISLIATKTPTPVLIYSFLLICALLFTEVSNRRRNRLSLIRQKAEIIELIEKNVK